MDELENIISQSSFTVIDGTFVYAKAASFPKELAKHFLISKDADEITVVTQQKNLEEVELIERNKDDYTLIALNVSVPFYSVGFLARVSRAIADEGMNILIISTYSKDYIMIRADLLDRALIALTRLGFKKRDPS